MLSVRCHYPKRVRFTENLSIYLSTPAPNSLLQNPSNLGATASHWLLYFLLFFFFLILNRMDAWSLMRGDAFIHFVSGSRRVNIRLGVLLLIPKSPQVHWVPCVVLQNESHFQSLLLLFCQGIVKPIGFFLLLPSTSKLFPFLPLLILFFWWNSMCIFYLYENIDVFFLLNTIGMYIMCISNISEWANKLIFTSIVLSVEC